MLTCCPEVEGCRHIAFLARRHLRCADLDDNRRDAARPSVLSITGFGLHRRQKSLGGDHERRLALDRSPSSPPNWCSWAASIGG